VQFGRQITIITLLSPSSEQNERGEKEIEVQSKIFLQNYDSYFARYEVTSDLKYTNRNSTQQ